MFSWEINLGHVITLGLAVIGGVGAWFTLRARVESHDGKIVELDKRIDAYGTALADHRLQVEMHCVKKTDLDRVEDRIGKRLDTVEHTIRNTSALILERLTSRASRPRTGS